MSIPWIEIKKYQEQDNLTSPVFSDYVWQAMFVFQVGIRAHQEWAKMRWGFNAQALFDEAMERRKLFLQSQYAVQIEMGMERMELPEGRTLAFRFVARPEQELLFAIVAKIHGRTQEEVHQYALSYFRELKSTFPYDYTLEPAVTREEFIRISGMDILEDKNALNMTQIKRLEVPIHPAGEKLPFLQGLWHSGPRTHEQIWRCLAAPPQPIILNMSIRSALLYDGEREEILKNANNVETITDEFQNKSAISFVKEWNRKYKERRLAPWKKFFYLQVLLASNQMMDDNIYRVVGASLCSNPEGETSPGFQIVKPREREKESWKIKLMNLDFVHSVSYLSTPRLSEIADMEEVFSVMRLPYSPPADGFPNLRFAGTSD
jgi:hypothetical protein